MKKNYTHVSALLDKSGSMESIKNDTIGGFNNFIKDQQKEDGEMTLSLSQFDSEYDIVHDFVNIHKVEPLTDKTFVPRGSTKLLDSLGRMIIDTGNKLANMSENERPEKVIFVITTDGQENASTEFKPEKIAEMVKHQEENYNWQFIYLGANQDAFTVGQSLGMQGVNYTASAGGTRAMYAAVSSNISLNKKSRSRVNLTQKDIEKEEKKNS